MILLPHITNISKIGKQLILNSIAVITGFLYNKLTKTHFAHGTHMEQIGKTYSAASNSAIYDAYRNSLKVTRNENQGGRAVAKGSFTSNRDQPTTDQLGIRPDTAKDQDFHLYGADGRISDNSKGAQYPGNKSGKQAVEDSTSITSKQQQDPRIQEEIARLKSAEEKVKAHEAAHKNTGGAITGPVSYTYTLGPDGRNYVTGGEVPITISTGSTPQETIIRMQQVIQAALAPADPSPQDRAVAAQAANIQLQAREETASQPATNASDKNAAATAVKKNNGYEEVKTQPAITDKTSNRAETSVATANTTYGSEKSISFYA